MKVTTFIEREVKKRVLKESYYHFFVWSFQILFPNEKYEDAFHVPYLCDVYQKEVERIIRKEEKDKDILVNIPPRASKSLITSVALLAWAWTKDPTMPMISVSFDEDLSLLNAQYCKDIINSPEYQELFGDMFQIRSDANSKGYFMNTKGGFRLSKTTGSNITGHKGILIIVDDPQNPKTAESEVKRKETVDYYTKSLYNRLTPINLGVRIIIMQRLHEEDLTGYLLKNSPEDYLHICLPAEVSHRVNPPSLVEEYVNGLLDPIRLSQKTLNGFRKTLGSRGYSGQYEQTPTPDEGGIWKKDWFDIVNPILLQRDFINEPIHIYIDGAYTEKTQNDPTGILAGFFKDNKFWIVDFKEVWLEFPDLLAYIDTYAKYLGLNRYSRIVVEPKASGKSIVQQLRAQTHYNVVEAPAPKDDKITRANGNAPILEGRRVVLVDGTYVENFLNLVSTFPNASHDEAVDLVNMAINDGLISNGPDFMMI